MENLTDSSPASDEQQMMKNLNDLLRNLRLYLAPCLTLLMIAGFAFVSFVTIKFGKEIKAKDFVLIVLTMADFVTIITTVFTREFLQSGLADYVTLQLPQVTVSWVCKFWSYFWLLSNSLSANLLCVMAADRVFAMCWPMRHRVVMTRQRHICVVTVVTATFAALSAVAPSTYDKFVYFGKSYCYTNINSHSPSVTMLLQLYTNLVVNGALPSTFLCCCNLLLCCRLWQIREKSKRLAQGVDDGVGRNVRGCVTLVLLASLYLLASLPRATVYFVAFLLYGSADVKDQRLEQLMFSLSQNFNYLFFINCSVNWLLYCIRVPPFCHHLPSCQRVMAASSGGSSSGADTKSSRYNHHRHSDKEVDDEENDDDESG